MTLTRLPRSTIQFTFVYNTYMLPVTVSDLDHLYFGQQNSPVGFPQAPPPPSAQVSYWQVPPGS